MRIEQPGAKCAESGVPKIKERMKTAVSKAQGRKRTVWYGEADTTQMRQHDARALANEAANYRANF
jgi:hypothetical protein